MLPGQVIGSGVTLSVWLSSSVTLIGLVCHVSHPAYSEILAVLIAAALTALSPDTVMAFAVAAAVAVAAALFDPASSVVVAAASLVYPPATFVATVFIEYNIVCTPLQPLAGELRYRYQPTKSYLW